MLARKKKLLLFFKLLLWIGITKRNLFTHAKNEKLYVAKHSEAILSLMQSIVHIGFLKQWNISNLCHKWQQVNTLGKKDTLK